MWYNLGWQSVIFPINKYVFVELLSIKRSISIQILPPHTSSSNFLRLKLKQFYYCGNRDILHLVIKNKKNWKKKTPIIYLLGEKIKMGDSSFTAKMTICFDSSFTAKIERFF